MVSAFALTFLILLLFAARPVHAQGAWIVSPCDAQGNLLSSPKQDAAGFYWMGGTESGGVTPNYPAPLMAAVAAGKWSSSGPGTPYLPFGITTLPLGPTYDPTAGISGVPLASAAAAFNQVDGMYATGNDPFWYSVNASYGSPNLGLLNGGVAVHLTGQLVFYFKVYWQSYGTVTPTSPMPASLSLLLKTQLKASANVSYGTSGQTSGLAASATATDGPPFSETASASAGDAAASSGPSSLVGYHLVTAAFAPLGSNAGIAEVYLNGAAQYQASNTVPYGTYTIVNPGVIAGKKTNGQTSADAEGSVLAGVRQDDRRITINADVDATSKKVPVFDASGHQTRDANGDLNFTTSPNLRDSTSTMYGDTVYSYHNFVTRSTGKFPVVVDQGTLNWIYFTPTFTGNWHYKAGTTQSGTSIVVPDVVDPDTWSWSPSESKDTWDYGKCSMPWAANYAETNGLPKGQDSPAIYNGSGVIYTATDNTDKATATAKYILTMHDPYEKNYSDHTQDITDDTNEKQIGGYGAQAPFDGSTISASVTTDNPWTVTVKASGEISLPWIGGAIGVDVEKSVTDNDKVGASCSDNHTHAGDYSYVEAVDHYIYHHGKADTWARNGYQGTQPYQVWEVATPAHFIRLHTPYKNATPGPPPHGN